MKCSAASRFRAKVVIIIKRLVFAATGELVSLRSRASFFSLFVCVMCVVFVVFACRTSNNPRTNKTLEREREEEQKITYKSKSVACLVCAVNVNRMCLMRDVCRSEIVEQRMWHVRVML